MEALGDLPGGSYDSVARGVSANGGAVVGGSESSAGYEAFRWTETGGMVGLGDLAGGDFSSMAFGISADGNVVVGSGTTDQGSEAFIWSPTLGMVSLEQRLRDQGANLNGWTELRSANGISADGRYVVGFGNFNGVPQSFIADLSRVTFTNVPEASTWAAAAAVVMAAGWIGWRRSR
jgi:probable HAF family extracellular repeat protein